MMSLWRRDGSGAQLAESKPPPKFLGFARTGYLIPGCDGDGAWTRPENSSVGAVAAAAVRYCSVLFGTVRNCSVLFATVRYCSVLFATVRYCSLLFILHCCNVHNKFTCISEYHNKFIISKGFLKATRSSGSGRIGGGGRPGGGLPLLRVALRKPLQIMNLLWYSEIQVNLLSTLQQ